MDAERQPKPLPEKLICNEGNVEARTLNAIIDYLAAREDNNGRA